MSVPTTVPRYPRCLEAVLLAAAFALAYTQSPLYFSNQNQYFLHGLAEGGLGRLKNDWLAQTRDPTPLFSWLVAAGYRWFGTFCCQVVYYLLLMGYFLSVRSLVAALPGIPDTRAFRLAFAAVFTATNAAIFRWLSVCLTGVDYPWYLQAGVAGQYLLGAGLQPSAFGALLMASVAAYAHRRPILAAFLAAAACAFHSTYLLPAGLLVVGYLVETFRSNSRAGPIAFSMLLVCWVIVLPVCAYIVFTFGSTNPELFADAQRILAEKRIPHHCIITRWLDVVAALQLAWAAAGLLLLRRKPLFPVLTIATGLAVVLTLIQYETGNPTLALLFPWRISALLVPLATAVIAARALAPVTRMGLISQDVHAGVSEKLIGTEDSTLTRYESHLFERNGDAATAHSPAATPAVPRSGRWIAWAAGVFLLLQAIAGAWVMLDQLGYRSGDEEGPLYDFVRSHAAAGDVYLIPVRVPPVGAGRGSISTSFTPPPRPKPGSNLIPVDLQRFRLLTGTPIYVDFKSVPYADFEVEEWFQRVQQCEAWYAADWSRAAVESEIKRERITHVVTPASRPIHAHYLVEIHVDEAYIVYQVK